MAGTSTVTLSVSSSTTVSPAATASPGCFIHRDRVASGVDSPSGGTFMVIIALPPSFRWKNITDEYQLARTHDLRARRARTAYIPHGSALAGADVGDSSPRPCPRRCAQSLGSVR